MLFDDPPIPQDRLPRTRAQALDWLRLARSRNVGSGSFRRLMARHASAADALEALPGLAAQGGTRDYVAADPVAVAAELARGEALGARLVCLGSETYPARLVSIADPPPVLWMRGNPALARRPTVALVGARSASASGLKLAQMLAAGIGAAGFVVVSGLARGIDTAAHRAGLGTGTIAVLAGGLDRIYPAENADLAEAIAAEGLILSEAPMGLEAQARHFPRRNRLISGLSQGVCLIEAAERSGSLVTARYALEQGREVMAVPGSPLDPRSGGCNRLLRQGAALIRSAEDMVEALALPGPQEREVQEPVWSVVEAPAPPDLAETIARLIASAPVAEDEIIRATGGTPGQVMEALVELDLAGRLERRPGGLVALAC